MRNMIESYLLGRRSRDLPPASHPLRMPCCQHRCFGPGSDIGQAASTAEPGLTRLDCVESDAREPSSRLESPYISEPASERKYES